MGTFRSIKSGVVVGDCGQCPTGYFCPKQCSTPVICPKGFYCAAAPTTADPIKCPKGTFGANTGLTKVADCQSCPAGRYCSQEGLDAPEGDCDPGYFCGGGAVTPVPTVRRRDLRTGRYLVGGACPAGGYCEVGSKSATRCPPGTYNPIPGQDHA